MYEIFCLDTDDKFYFQATSPFNALYKMLYTLNSRCEDRSAMIAPSATGKTLSFVHRGLTYAVINNIIKEG